MASSNRQRRTSGVRAAEPFAAEATADSKSRAPFDWQPIDTATVTLPCALPQPFLTPAPLFSLFRLFFSFSFPAPLFAPRRWHSRKPKIAGSCCAERAEGVIGAATLYEDVVTPRAAVPNLRQVSPKIVGREAPGRACSSCGARVYL